MPAIVRLWSSFSGDFSVADLHRLSQDSQVAQRVWSSAQEHHRLSAGSGHSMIDDQRIPDSCQNFDSEKHVAKDLVPSSATIKEHPITRIGLCGCWLLSSEFKFPVKPCGLECWPCGLCALPVPRTPSSVAVNRTTCKQLSLVNAVAARLSNLTLAESRAKACHLLPLIF